MVEGVMGLLFFVFWLWVIVAGFKSVGRRLIGLWSLRPSHLTDIYSSRQLTYGATSITNQSQATVLARRTFGPRGAARLRPQARCGGAREHRCGRQ